MLALPMNHPAPHLHAQTQDASSTSSPLSSRHTSTSDPSSLTSSKAMLSSLQSTTSSNKKPKLSLQTGGLPITFGKSTTALAISLSTAPTASPTALNTFNNAYDVPHRSSPANTSPSGWKSNRPSSRLVSPYVSQNREDHPYQMPRGVRGILRNPPFPSSIRRSSIATNSAGSATRRMFFPAPKRVTYRTPLEEEIRTVRFVARHSDLPSDESGADTQSDGSEDSEGSKHSDSTDEDGEGNRSKSRKKRKSVEGHSERQVRAAAIRDGLAEDAEFEPSTPAHTSQRKRRKREWKWTLSPLDENNGAATSSAETPDVESSESQDVANTARSSSPSRNSHASLLPSEIPLPSTPVS